MSTPEIGSRFFDALMETFIPLIGQTARFQNITGTVGSPPPRRAAQPGSN